MRLFKVDYSIVHYHGTGGGESVDFETLVGEGSLQADRIGTEWYLGSVNGLDVLHFDLDHFRRIEGCFGDFLYTAHCLGTCGDDDFPFGLDISSDSERDHCAN